jgi:hypothetical protein
MKEIKSLIVKNILKLVHYVNYDQIMILLVLNFIFLVSDPFTIY